MIGLNKDLNMFTNFSAVCNVPPSVFVYCKGDEKKTIFIAVLSTTIKAKAREAKKGARKLSE